MESEEYLQKGQPLCKRLIIKKKKNNAIKTRLQLCGNGAANKSKMNVNAAFPKW